MSDVSNQGRRTRLRRQCNGTDRAGLCKYAGETCQAAPSSCSSELAFMTDGEHAHLLAHRRNINRYARLLRTRLSDHERQYLKKLLWKSEPVWTAALTNSREETAGRTRRAEEVAQA